MFSFNVWAFLITTSMSNDIISRPKCIMLCSVTSYAGYVSTNTALAMQKRDILTKNKNKKKLNQAFISTDSVAFNYAYFGAGNGTIHLHVVGCIGNETKLIDCPEVRSNRNCLQGHLEDAGVRCQGL